jgi:hypothetical protein
VRDPIDEGRGPVKRLEWRKRFVNEVRDPMEEGREPVKELELRVR